LGDFCITQNSVEDCQIILMADIRGSEHESDGFRIPTKAKVPVLDTALLLAVEVKAAGRLGGLAVYIRDGESDMRPGIT
jgi:hypothetical protein